MANAFKNYDDFSRLYACISDRSELGEPFLSFKVLDDTAKVAKVPSQCRGIISAAMSFWRHSLKVPFLWAISILCLEGTLDPLGFSLPQNTLT